jgi:GNAT superfamily N-acetyltransferase
MIRPIADEDLGVALTIAEEGLGVGWLGLDDLRPTPGRRVVVAEHDGRVAGVASAVLRDVEGLLEAARADVGAALRAEIGPSSTPTLVLLDMAVVAPSARGRGLYRALLDDRIAWGRREGADLAIALGWTPPDGCHIAPAMARAGFTALAEVAGAYRSSSLSAGAACAACGPPPCECASILFSRWIGAA